MGDTREHTRITPMPASFLAQRALAQLDQDPDLKRLCVLGRRLTAEENQENQRRAALREQRRAEIIVEHGVTEDYLVPLIREAERLEAELANVRDRIRILEEAKSRPKA